MNIGIILTKVIFYFILIIGFFGCASTNQSVKTANVAANAAVVAGVLATGTAPAGAAIRLTSASPYQIQIVGTVFCENDNLFPFKLLRVDFFDNGRLTTSIDVDTYGNFDSVYKSRVGTHVAKLVTKKTSQTLDTAEFSSTKEKDRIAIRLTACKNN